MQRQTGHRWQPIADLPSDWHKWQTRDLDDLLRLWNEAQTQLANAQLVEQFNTHLIRRWSIETGILERIYELSDSVTLTLVEQGFDAALISHGDSNRPADEVIRILEDHREAAEGLFAFIKQERRLGTSYIKELHSVLTRHQTTCEAIDSLGRLTAAPLLRGDYKKLPNNPGDPRTGILRHEYCPPEQVASEMETLVALHAQHVDVPYEIEAAWLHHRLTQIHPFQDGNGRVARALATLVCLRAGAFPLVIDRRQKVAYLAALEKADGGDLDALVLLFRGQQKQAFLQAISLSEQSLSQQRSLEAIVEDTAERVRAALVRQRDTLLAFSTRLAQLAHQRLDEVAKLLAERVGKNVKFEAVTFRSDQENAHWFRGQIVATAKHFDYLADFNGRVQWARLRIRHGATSDLLVSFHGLGRSKAMVVTAMLSQRDADAAEAAQPFATKPVCDEPFVLAPGRDLAELERAFSTWLERALGSGLEAWQRNL